jgi:hypothetical protein
MLLKIQKLFIKIIFNPKAHAIPDESPSQKHYSILTIFANSNL